MKMMGNDGIPPFPPPAGSYLRAPTRNHGKVRILTRAQNPTGLYHSVPSEGTEKSDPADKWQRNGAFLILAGILRNS